MTWKVAAWRLGFGFSKLQAGPKPSWSRHRQWAQMPFSKFFFCFFFLVFFFSPCLFILTSNLLELCHITIPPPHHFRCQWGGWRVHGACGPHHVTTSPHHYPIMSLHNHPPHTAHDNSSKARDTFDMSQALFFTYIINCQYNNSRAQHVSSPANWLLHGHQVSTGVSRLKPQYVLPPGKFF